jgi:succinate dehydrogenase/fumarate reductase flavoprotein subunit
MIMRKLRNCGMRGVLVSLCVLALVIGLAACPTETKTEKVTETVYVEVDTSAWLEDAPNITDSMVSETKTADVVIVGAGISGLATARSAAENGASVIVIEQQSYEYTSDTGQAPSMFDPNVMAYTSHTWGRGLCFGAINSTYQKSLGQVYSEADKMNVVREMQKISGNRANMALWTKWVNESGAAFDWFTSILTPTTGDDAWFGPIPFPAGHAVDTKGYYLEMWPLPAAFDNSTEYYPQFQSSIAFGTLGGRNWPIAQHFQYDESRKHGAEYLWETTGKKLVQDASGKVTGVYAQKKDGTYIKVNANKGVVLATGDYGANAKMVKALNPEFYEALTGGITGYPTSTGEGHKMAIWAGGRMEVAPHAHMNHSFAGGFGGIGATVALHLNKQGKRFMNEDVPGQVFTNQLVRQPGHTSFQVFDSDWVTQVGLQSVGHGNLDLSNTYDEQQIKDALAAAVADDTMSGVKTANTIEELVEKMGFTSPEYKQNAINAIKHYTEMANKAKTDELATPGSGVDPDFGTRVDRLYPLNKAPFFFSTSMIANGVANGGVMVDEELRVLKEVKIGEGILATTDFQPISGLWAVGNVAGGRYSTDYPTTSPATSHGTAITFGKWVGKHIAER